MTTSANTRKHTMQTLFDSTNLGALQLSNRIIMAPMSRNRAPDGIAPAMTVDYYRQRAGAGLIVAESSEINAMSGGMDAPGLFTDDQVAGWRQVTEAVHQAGGRIVVQLWHAGRVTHSSLLPQSAVPVAPSVIRSTRELLTPVGMTQVSTPRALTLNEIAVLVDDYRNAAQRALDAGFDGVEIHAGAGYLLDQFLQDSANQRSDEYGGSVANRIRLVVETIDAVAEIVGTERVGFRISPTSGFNDMADSDPTKLFTALIAELNDRGLAYLHVLERLGPGASTSEQQALIDTVRNSWTGRYVANGGYLADTADAYIAAGYADAVSFGSTFLANPDLPERFRLGIELNKPNPDTFYGGNELGYTDYPTHNAAQGVNTR